MDRGGESEDAEEEEDEEKEARRLDRIIVASGGGEEGGETAEVSTPRLASSTRAVRGWWRFGCVADFMVVMRLICAL